MIKKTITILSSLFLGWNANAQFSENFTTQNGWTTVGNPTFLSITNGVVKYANCADGQSYRTYKNHGLTLSDNWVLETEFQFTGVGPNGPGHHIASVTAGVLDPVSTNTFVATNQDAIAMMFYSTNNSNTPANFELVGTSKNDNNAWVNSAGIVLSSGKTYYLRLERLNLTQARISAFLDPARTVHATNSPQCFNISKFITTNLTTVQHGNSCWGGTGRKLTGSIDNTTLNNFASVETISEDQEVCNGTGNPDAFTSIATSNNPNVTYQWEVSTDNGVSWQIINGATALTYDPPAGISGNTLYRRGTIHPGLCSATKYSNTVTVTVVTCNSLSCDFSTDFTDDAGWSTQGVDVNISNGTFNYDECFDGTSNRMFTDHNVNMTNSWRLDFDFIFTDYASGGPGHHLASLTEGTLDPVSGSNGTPWTPTNQDAISAMFFSTNHTNNINTFSLIGCSKNDNNAWINSAGILLSEDVEYFITLERLDQTHGRISAYTDFTRTVHIAGSPQCFDINPNVTEDLDVLQHGNTSWGGNDRSLTGTIDNDCLSLMTFTAGTISKDAKAPCGGIPTSILSTAPASGPNNFYTFNYVWQQSPDGATWTDVTPAATALNFSPPVLYATTFYRRVAILQPCGLVLISNTIVRNVSIGAALNSEFSLQVNCQTGQSQFFVTATPVVSSGNNFHGNWFVTDVTLGTPAYSDPLWENDNPCLFGGYAFIPGHTYQIQYLVYDTCSQQGSTIHTVTCSAGMVQHDGKVIEREYTINSLIHPNPTSGVFTIDFKDLAVNEISIYNAQGRLIRSIAIAENVSISRVDLSDQPNGMYLVKLHTESGFMTNKLIKE